MKNSIAKNVLPNILSNLFEMKKQNQIVATDSAIRKYAKKQALDYADKAYKHVINKTVKTALDTVTLTLDEQIKISPAQDGIFSCLKNKYNKYKDNERK